MKWPFVALALAGTCASLLVALPARRLDISGYKTWRVANATPVKMSNAVAALCIGPSARQLASTNANSPHQPYYLKVFVNPFGEKEFMKGDSSRMPVGTVIVKEKLASPKAAHPALCTVMRKREPGFDPKHGDWEYSVVDKSGALIEQGAIPRCISCHEQQNATDYVYRSYMHFK